MTTTAAADTEATTEEEPRRQSDTRIACQLVRGGYITAAAFDVWRRSRAGETIYRMRRDYPNAARGSTFSAMTLYRWCEQVEKAIADARTIETPVGRSGRERYSIAVASGHDVRDAANPTPAGRVSTEASSWDAERLRAAGFVDRYSRKR